MFPWDKELHAYKTYDQLVTLAKALEVPFRLPDDVYFDRSGNVAIPEDICLQTKMDLLKMDIYEEMLVRREKKNIERLLFGQEQKFCFVTVGFNDNHFDDTNEALLINPAIEKIVATPGFDNVQFVVEKFRKNEKGEVYIHRHVHLLIDTNLRKGKVIQYIFQKAKKICDAPNFIDYKIGERFRFEKYIKGDKTDGKLECVEMDKKWRSEKKIITM